MTGCCQLSCSENHGLMLPSRGEPTVGEMYCGLFPCFSDSATAIREGKRAIVSHSLTY